MTEIYIKERGENLHFRIQKKLNKLVQPVLPKGTFKKRKIEIDKSEIMYSKDSTDAQVLSWNPCISWDNSVIRLNLKDFSKLKGGHQFVLEENYTLKGCYHNSFVDLLKNIKFSHTFAFQWPLEDVGTEFFNKLSGLKKSTFTSIKETRTGEEWELHLRGKKDKSVVLGYLLKVWRAIITRAK
jgi:hypothetical protein